MRYSKKKKKNLIIGKKGGVKVGGAVLRLCIYYGFSVASCYFLSE